MRLSDKATGTKKNNFFRENLRLMLEVHRSSPAKLAIVTKIKESTIQFILDGTINNPNEYTIYRIAHHFHYEADIFVKTPPGELEKIRPTIPKFEKPLTREEFDNGKVKKEASPSSAKIERIQMEMEYFREKIELLRKNGITLEKMASGTRISLSRLYQFQMGDPNIKNLDTRLVSYIAHLGDWDIDRVAMSTPEEFSGMLARKGALNEPGKNNQNLSRNYEKNLEYVMEKYGLNREQVGLKLGGIHFSKIYSGGNNYQLAREVASALGYDTHTFLNSHPASLPAPDPQITKKMAETLNAKVTLERQQPKEEFFYRGDSRKPEFIFEHGFEPQGENAKLLDHVGQKKLGFEKSAFVGFSKAKEKAALYPINKAATETYIYELGPQADAIDVQEALDPEYPQKGPNPQLLEEHPAIYDEQEKVVQRKIKPENIRGAWKVEIVRKEVPVPGRPDLPAMQVEVKRVIDNTFIQNPKYVPSAQVATVPEKALSKSVELLETKKNPAQEKPNLYRGDARPPEQIFKEGFKARGRNPNLVEHAMPVGEDYLVDSKYISASLSKKVAKDFPKPPPAGVKQTYLYEIGQQKNAIDVAKEINGKLDPEDFEIYRAEKEMAVPEKIKPQDIKGAWVVEVKQKNLGFDEVEYVRKVTKDYVPNAKYLPPGQKAPAVWDMAKVHVPRVMEALKQKGIAAGKFAAGFAKANAPLVAGDLALRFIADTQELEQARLMQAGWQKNPTQALAVFGKANEQIVVDMALAPLNAMGQALVYPIEQFIDRLKPVEQAQVQVPGFNAVIRPTIEAFLVARNIAQGAVLGLQETWEQYQKHAQTWNQAAAALLAQVGAAFMKNSTAFLNEAKANIHSEKERASHDSSRSLDSFERSFASFNDRHSFAPSGFYGELRSVGLYENYGRNQGWGGISFGKWGGFSFTGSRFMGGVASGKGKIEGFKNSALDVLFDEHIFCMPLLDGKALFSVDELHTLIQELSAGIYMQGPQAIFEAEPIYPFVSLHINRKGSLYPILHPFYQKTLVGETIGILDYFLKGFLNGDIFSADFIRNWEAHPNYDRAFLKTQLIGLKALYQQQKQSYTSLREKLTRAGFDHVDFNQRFQLSFRIIAKQKNISHHENVFLFEPDFTVEYSLYELGSEKLSKDFGIVRAICEEECREIREKMPCIPIFQEYFQKLGIISFFCLYLKALKDSGKAVEFRQKLNPPRSFPNELPSLPVRYYRMHPVQIIFGDVIKALGDTQELELYLQNRLNTYRRIFPETLIKSLTKSCRQILVSKSPAEFLNPDDLEENIEELIRKIKKILKNGIVQIREEQNKLFRKMIQQFSLDIDLSKVEGLKTGEEKFSALQAAIQKKPAEEKVLRRTASILLENVKPYFIDSAKAFLPSFANIKLMDQSRHSTVDIDPEGSLVVGGCAMDLNSLPLNSATLPETQLREIQEKASTENLTSLVIGNQTQAIFRLKTQNCQVYSPSLELNDQKENSETSALFSAVMTGDTQSLGLFIRKNPALAHAKNPRRANLTQVAAENGMTDMLNTLISYGAKADEVLPNDLFPLYVAILNGHRETALALVEKTPLNLSVDGGNTALHLAIEQGETEIALKLIARGADLAASRKSDAYTALHLAAEMGLNEVFIAILSRQNSVNAALPSKKTPLHLAASRGQLQTLQILHEKYQGNINLASETLETPLMLALSEGHFHCARYLAERAEINALNSLGQTASLLAAALGQFDIAMMLIERGEDPLHLDANGNCVIYYLLRTGHYHYYKVLSEKLNLDHAMRFHDEKALGIAVRFEHTLLEAYLRSKGAQGKWPRAPSLMDERDEIFIALTKGSKKLFDQFIKKWLERGWKDINDPHPDMKFSLSYYVTDYGLANLIPYFISRGLDFSLPCTQGTLTPFHVVAQRGNSYFLKKLFKAVPREKWPADWQELKSKISPISSRVESALMCSDPNEAAIIQSLKEVDETKFLALMESFSINSRLLMYKGVRRPLLHIIFKMNAEWALALIKRDVDVSVLDEQGSNVLHLMAESSKEKFSLQWKLLNAYFPGTPLRLSAIENKKGETPFSIAIQHHRVWVLEAHLQENTSGELDINLNCETYPSKPRYSLMHMAVLMQNEKIIHMLCDQGFDVNVENYQHVTPLMLAAQTGNVRVIQFLLARGANADARDMYQNTALHYAISNEHLKATLYLAPLTRDLTRKNFQGNTPFMLAAAKGYLPLMALIYQTDSNCRQRNKKGFNALDLAAQHGQIDAIDYLVEIGFSVRDVQTRKNLIKNQEKARLSPLQLAARRGDMLTCLKLISLGADPLEPDNSCYTMIDRLIESNSIDAIFFLKSLGLEAKENYFLRAAVSNNIPMMMYLLKSGININACNEKGKNALFQACETSSEKSVAFLLERGIDYTTETLQAETVLHAAARSGSVNILRQLNFLNAIVDFPNDEDKTPFFIACEKGQYGAALFLLENGADANYPDKHGTLPIEVAEKNGHEKIVELLQSHCTLGRVMK